MGRDKELSSRRRGKHKKSSKSNYGYENYPSTTITSTNDTKYDDENNNLTESTPTTESTYEEIEQPSKQQETSSRHRRTKHDSTTRDSSKYSRNDKYNRQKLSNAYMLQHRRDSDDTIDSRSVDTSKPLKDDHFECHQHFIGAMLAKDVGKSVKPNEFVIYYQLPDVNGPLPFKLRLFLAYKSNQTKEVFHFPIVCGTNQRSGEPSWSLRYADSATFPTLADLIKYHKIYSYMDPNTGKVETFPVWKDVLIDVNEFE